MPTYDYVCRACGHRIEVMHGVHEQGPDHLPELPRPGAAQGDLLADHPLQGQWLGQEGPRFERQDEGGREGRSADGGSGGASTSSDSGGSGSDKGSDKASDKRSDKGSGSSPASGPASDGGQHGSGGTAAPSKGD